MHFVLKKVAARLLGALRLEHLQAPGFREHAGCPGVTFGKKYLSSKFRFICRRFDLLGLVHTGRLHPCSVQGRVLSALGCTGVPYNLHAGSPIHVYWGTVTTRALLLVWHACGCRCMNVPECTQGEFNDICLHAPTSTCTCVHAATVSQ